MKPALALTFVAALLCTSAGAQTQQNAYRDTLIQELTKRLNAQRVQLPAGLVVRGAGVYKEISGRGAASATVNTVQGVRIHDSEDHWAGVFTESAEASGYEGLLCETPPGIGSLAEIVSRDFYKPALSPGWSRMGTKQLNKPSQPVRYSQHRMESGPGISTQGAGPFATQGATNRYSAYSILTNEHPGLLDEYTINASTDGALRTITLTKSIPEDRFLQEFRHTFDDSRNGVVVAVEMKLIGPPEGHVAEHSVAQYEYVAAPSLLAGAGIPYILTRYHAETKSTPKGGGDPLTVKFEESRFNEIEVIAGKPSPPTWFVKQEKAWAESEAYKATLAAQGS